MKCCLYTTTDVFLLLFQGAAPADEQEQELQDNTAMNTETTVRVHQNFFSNYFFNRISMSHLFNFLLCVFFCVSFSLWSSTFLYDQDLYRMKLKPIIKIITFFSFLLDSINRKVRFFIQLSKLNLFFFLIFLIIRTLR